MSGSRGIVIAGGGTAGHLLPGIAVADELVARGRDRSSIRFIGSARGIEATAVPEAGYDVLLLAGRGIQRRFTWANVGAVWGLIRAAVGATWSLIRHRPAVVLALGGYASVTAAVAAVVLRIPLVVAEQNARAGAANRLVGRFARSCAVPVEGTDLPHAVVTGNPVRAEVLAAAADRRAVGAQLRAERSIPADRTLVVAFAGSLGARRINEAVVDLVERWGVRADVHVHHVLGARDWDTLERPQPSPGGIGYTAVRYEEHIPAVLAAADVAVCRSGGTTVAELAVLGLPSVLVPLPIAPRDHQTANARPLVDAGAAALVADGELDGARLCGVLDEMLASDRLASMAAAAAALGRPDAAARVADLIGEVTGVDAIGSTS